MSPETQDDLAGIAWWNALTEEDRLFWCRAAITATPAEAWRYYKRAMSQDVHDLEQAQ